MRILSGLAALRDAKASELGTSDWLTLSQADIDAFASATRDHQWIHTQPDRAERGPFGATVAHGLFTLALLPYFASQIYRVDGVAGRVNYGYNRVRFPAPVRSGARVRAKAMLNEVTDIVGGARATIVYTVELEGASRPACVAESIVQFMEEV